MKKKLSIFAFGLLLAVGWTNVASAQKLDLGKPWYASAFFTKMHQPTMDNGKTAQTVEVNFDNQEILFDSPNGAKVNRSKAPKRANYTITSNVTHVKSWYDAKHYTWYDADNNEQTASYTDPVTDAHQMFWFTRSLYSDPTMPGIKFSAAQNFDSNTVGFDLAYEGCDFGYWISGDVTEDIGIYMTSYCYITAIFVYDYAGNLITSYDVDDGSTPPNGWSMPYGDYMTRTVGNDGWYYWKWSSNNYTDFYQAFQISKDLLTGKGGVYVDVLARQAASSSATRDYSYFVGRYDYNKQTTYIGEKPNLPSSWTHNVAMVHGTVTPPTENGYSVVLVKLTDDFDYTTGQAEMYTYTDSALYAYFDKYIDEMVLLTDGLRLEEGQDDAGTLFTYSGMLNKFYFISKGKTYPISGSENSWQTNSNTGVYERHADRAPFYNMYEEFSPTTQSNTTGIDDFYSRMLEGESYDIIHDCQSVNYMEHFFSMTGTGGTEQKSMTNLLLWIPDHRSKTSSRDYDEEYLPKVGMYTITLTAEAKPVANYSESNRYYDVTCNWVSSLNTMMDFDVDQTYQLWIFVYDEQGNPVPVPETEGGLLYTGPNTTYTYQVPQYPDSYTIIYRVKGWPTDATNNPVNGGDFYAWSNLDDVLIPGYNDFLTLHLDHYESDFVIDEEHNYYRNFFNVDNQNPENVLTAQRVIDGENLFKLYRYDVADENNKVKAAELRFYKSGNDIRYKVDYFDQQILAGYELPMTTPQVIDTAGVVATLGGDKYVKVTNNTDLTSGQYLIVYEDGSVAFDGSLPGASSAAAGTLPGANNNFAVTITNHTIPSNATTDASSFTIDMSAGTIQSASGYYIGRTSNNNGLQATTNVYTNTISIDGSGNAVIVGSGGAYMRYNTASNANCFRYYQSSTYTGQKAIQLYKKTSGGGGTTPSVNPVGDVKITFASYSIVFNSITIDGNNLTTPLTWTYGQTWPSNWSTSASLNDESSSYNGYSIGGTSGGTITIPATLLNGSTQVTVTMQCSRYSANSSATNCAITVAGATTPTQTVAAANSYPSYSPYTWTVNGTTSGAKAMAPKKANRAYTLLNDDLDNTKITTSGNISLSAPWQATNVTLQSSGTSAGYFYIQSSGNLKFTVPAGYNGANLKFVVRNAAASSSYYAGTFNFASSSGATQSVNCNTANTDYEAIFTNVSPGDVITITGTYGSYNYSPDFSYIHVYVEGGSSEYNLNDPLYLAEIQIVDQFKAETKRDQHPYRYGYYLQYDPPTGDPKKSSVDEVPVQHTGSNPHGFYTTQEIQNDTLATLTMNVMNAEMLMTLADNPAIYYYTLDRKPSTTPNADWLEISNLQIRVDGSYQERDELLTQYKEQIVNPGPVERYDNYNVQTGNYDDYMSYVPIVWTHGDQAINKRIKWESEHLHNSYGAPIWKTGVGDARILSADSWRQQGKYGSTNWADENGDSCSLYFLEIKAEGILPSNNTVGNQNGYAPYIPYWFNVYAVSQSGKLRGYSQVGTPGTDPDNTGSAGSHLVNNPLKNRYIWWVYGGPTSDGYLEKNLSNTYAENFRFGALDNISDLKIVVRFYYVVNGMVQSTDYVMDRDGAPAGYGAESPGFSPEPHTGIIEVLKPNHGSVESTTYVNPQGMQSDKPFDGVNIIITRYEDGTTSTTKVIR